MTPWAEMPPIVNAKTLTTSVWSFYRWYDYIFINSTYYEKAGCYVDSNRLRKKQIRN